MQLVTAAFGLVAALAWNEAIQGLFTLIFGEAGDLAAKFLYAVLITVIVVFITVRLGRLAERVKKRRRRRGFRELALPEVLRRDLVHPVLEFVYHFILRRVLHRLLEDNGGLFYNVV